MKTRAHRVGRHLGFNAEARRPGLRAAASTGGSYGEANVKRWMRSHIAEYVDPLTGEVNTTKLAEEAAYEANRSEWLDDHTHPIWDWATEEAERYERTHRSTREVRQGHRVADFNTLEHLVEHAASELGATHVSGAGPTTKIYFPRGGEYPYEAASVRRKGGYWHADGPGAREGVKKLPAGARPIGGHVGRRAAEAPRRRKEGNINFQAGERLRIRIEGSHGQTFETFSYTPDYMMSLDDVALRFSQTIQPGMFVVISSGREKWIFQKETHGGQNAVKRLQETRSVRDYIAVDRRGHTIAGPFKSYGDAKSAAGTAGVVKYMRPRTREAPRFPMRKKGPGKGFTDLEIANAAGGKYAVDQLQSTHFDDWVRDQLIEASKMPEDQVIPLKTNDDARKIAGKMLQQLEWDAKRDVRQDELGQIIGLEPSHELEEAFWKGFHKGLMDSIPWLADEILYLNREIRRR